MDVVILPDPQAVCTEAASRLARQIEKKPNSVLGLATGNTMVKVYQRLVQRYQEKEQGTDGTAPLDFSQVTTFNLDEYVGLEPGHPSSYHSYMNKHLFSRVNLSPQRVFLPDAQGPDFERAGHEYERQIEDAGGIDLQLLGLGVDGHIGFNEPCSSLGSRTRLKTLTPMTRSSNRGDFGPGEPVPVHVITMGIATILEADQCLLLAYGEGKAAAVAAMVEGPLSALTPASALQWHPKTTVIVDEAAASQLKMADYFRFIHRHWVES